MTVKEPTVVYLLTGSAGSPMVADLVEHLDGSPETMTKASSVLSPPGSLAAAFPAVACDGYSSLDILYCVGIGGAVAIETSPDGISWSEVTSLPASDPYLKRARCLVDEAAFVRARLTSGRDVSLTLIGSLS